MSRTDLLALAAVALLVLTMPVFAIRARGRPLDPEVAQRPTTVLLGYWIRDWLMWVLAPLERLFVRARISPEVFNYLGAGLGLAAGIAFALGQPGLGGWLVLLGGAADIFDGRVARARGLASPYGAFLDSTLDRFAETFTFVGVAWYLAATPWTVPATVLAASGSLLVSYTRARGEALGVTCRGGVMQRAERLVLLALAALLDSVVTAAAGWPPKSLLAGAVAIIGLGSFATAIYRSVYIARVMQRSHTTTG
jgi:phosphatidylglycerophosphate synthase